MRIYANGCSFTHGDELDDINFAWPIVLGNRLTAQVTNDAISGGTNYRTVYRTIKNLKNDYDLYLIAWTTNTRLTFYKSDNNFEVNFNPQLNHFLYSKEKFYCDWGNTLYKIWYNELYSFKIWLQQIIQLQALLDKDNREYLMINTFDNNLSNWLVAKEQFIPANKNLINFNLMDDNQIFDEYDEIQYYVKLINKDKFYQWNDFNIYKLSTQFRCGPNGHILEQGHNHLANLIYNHLCSK